MCLWAIYIIPGSVHNYSCSRIGRLIVGLYKSLTDTWMWKLRLRPRSSFSGNICFEFAVLCLCSAEWIFLKNGQLLHSMEVGTTIFCLVCSHYYFADLNLHRVFANLSPDLQLQLYKNFLPLPSRIYCINITCICTVVINILYIYFSAKFYIHILANGFYFFWCIVFV